MRNRAILAVAMLLTTGSAFSQNSAVAPAPKPAAVAPMGAAGENSNAHAPQVKLEAKPEAKSEAKPAASTPESRSAAALALSHEPTFDEGTAQRIREAALSYSDIALRGGWPTIPAEAKFVLGAAG